MIKSSVALEEYLKIAKKQILEITFILYCYTFPVMVHWYH